MYAISRGLYEHYFWFIDACIICATWQIHPHLSRVWTHGICYASIWIGTDSLTSHSYSLLRHKPFNMFCVLVYLPLFQQLYGLIIVATHPTRITVGINHSYKYVMELITYHKLAMQLQRTIWSEETDWVTRFSKPSVSKHDAWIPLTDVLHNKCSWLLCQLWLSVDYINQVYKHTISRLVYWTQSSNRQLTNHIHLYFN